MAAPSSNSDTSPTLRVDALTTREVIVAANRSGRPMQVRDSNASQAEAYDPFLEGHEHDTPSESLALRRTDSKRDQPGWLLRVVPNRYPAVVQPTGETSKRSKSKFEKPANGVHEVVIECPDSRTRLADFSISEVARILTAWQLRVRALAKLPGIKAVNIFRNEGAMAGASLAHCHSQIIASGFGNRPAEVRAVIEDTLVQVNTPKYPFQHWLEREISDGDRILNVDDGLAACCPFASRVAWHVRFCPDAGEQAAVEGFEMIGSDRIGKLAARVLSVVRALHNIHGEVAFNLLLTLPPVDRPGQFPWMLDLMPRTSHFAGFELLSNIDIITTAPEDAAAQLRDAVQWQSPPGENERLWPENYEWQEG